MFSGNFLSSTSISEEPAIVETSLTEQSRHVIPEVAIGIMLGSLEFHGRTLDTN